MSFDDRAALYYLTLILALAALVGWIAYLDTRC